MSRVAPMGAFVAAFTWVHSQSRQAKGDAWDACAALVRAAGLRTVRLPLGCAGREVASRGGPRALACDMRIRRRSRPPLRDGYLAWRPARPPAVADDLHRREELGLRRSWRLGRPWLPCGVRDRRTLR